MSDLQSTAEISWFYTENGERKGPVSEREMIRLITSSVIVRGTYIWNKGLPDWLKVENTYLHTHLDNSAPPPMPGRRINPNMPGVGLASRGSRLGASLLDGLLMCAITIPIMYFTGGFDFAMSEGVIQQQSFMSTLAMAFVGIAVFCAINLKSLIASGQTIGKRAVGIKIVDMDGNLPTLEGHLLKRYGVYFIPGYIPVVGAIFNLVNILCIFGPEKRCIHDLAGGTKVINC